MIIFIALLVMLLTPSFSKAACTGSSPTWNCPADIASIELLIESSSPGTVQSGDVVNVASGTINWNTNLTINNNISLIGAGVGLTVANIATGTGLTWNLLNNTTLARLSGFTFDGGGTNCLIEVFGTFNTAPAAKLDRIRIDHNRFTNTQCKNSPNSKGPVAILDAWGVIDHNTFDTMAVNMRFWGSGFGTGAAPWTNWGPLVPGTDQTMWIENNTLGLSGTIYLIADCDLGGRHSWRYNTFTSGTQQIDWHGFTSSANHGCFGGEFYGNSSTLAGRGPTFRGGISIIFDNLMGSPDGHQYLYHNDSGCPSDQNEAINNSYSFLNRITATGAITEGEFLNSTCNMAVQDTNFWSDKVFGPFATYPSGGGGSSNGVRYGATNSRIGVSCSVGQAYWETDQSITDLTGMVGTSHTITISGTLYKCTSPNVWTASYTPFTYPHPLIPIGGSTISIMNGGIRATGGVRVQ